MFLHIHKVTKDRPLWEKIVLGPAYLIGGFGNCPVENNKPIPKFISFRWNRP